VLLCASHSRASQPSYWTMTAERAESNVEMKHAVRVVFARLADRQQNDRQRQAEEQSTPHRQMQAAVTHGSAGVPDA
jgi:hypothetical protein